jgi:hypothetical protein
MERTRQERNREEEQVLIRRMKDECDQALARQWKLANEQLSLVMTGVSKYVKINSLRSFRL